MARGNRSRAADQEEVRARAHGAAAGPPSHTRVASHNLPLLLRPCSHATLSLCFFRAQELAELQKRFNALSDQQRATEASSSLLLATRKSAKPRSLSASTTSFDGASTKRDATGIPPEEELKRLDDQIVTLRRKHDQLHEKNQKKRSELDILADKLKDLHNTRFNPKETPEARLSVMEDRLNECAARYDEEHRLKMSYEQVIHRLKKEQLEWPAEVKQLEALLAQKEQDYEQLLVMSHDANSSKEAAKVELGKFESLVLDERKQRERELQERRAVRDEGGPNRACRIIPTCTLRRPRQVAC